MGDNINFFEYLIPTMLIYLLCMLILIYQNIDREKYSIFYKVLLGLTYTLLIFGIFILAKYLYNVKNNSSFYQAKSLLSNPLFSISLIIICSVLLAYLHGPTDSDNKYLKNTILFEFIRGFCNIYILTMTIVYSSFIYNWVDICKKR